MSRSDLLTEARDYANRRTGTVPGDLVLRLVIELETVAAERDAAVRDLDAGFAESDHLSAKYYQRMRDAEALAQKANLSIIGLVRMANERAAVQALRKFRADLIGSQFAQYGIVLPDINEIVDALDEAAARIEQNSEGNET